MPGIHVVKRWFLAPPISGYRAILFGLAAVALPTLIRASVQGSVSGIVFSSYIPFVLLSAIALEWTHAAVVALVSAFVARMLFIEPRFVFLAGPTDVFGIAVFLVASAMIIKFVSALKGVVVDVPGSATARRRNGIVFSLEGGDAWASWQGDSCSIRLGNYDEVAEMMQDFLAHRDLASDCTARASRQRAASRRSAARQV